MAFSIIKYSMKKRGQAEAIGAIVLIGILILGGYGSYKIISDNRYVGDKDTKIVYDLKYCNIKIAKENVVSFTTKEKAYELDFKDAECNK